ncbi:MAG: metalloregulator ArsR/SmtB family transcription factor [Eubacteriales bacterium]|nr:metalloregulator ArsR/SmtB family transcription factor [Eubacteriales bacterium]
MQRCTQDIALEPIPEDEAKRLAEFLKVFADADRIRILALLKDKEVCVGHIADALGKSISAVSHQLGLMRARRLVRYVKDGKNTYYTLDDDHVSMLLDAAREHCRHV